MNVHHWVFWFELARSTGMIGMVKVVELFIYVKQEDYQSRCYLKMRKSF